LATVTGFIDIIVRGDIDNVGVLGVKLKDDYGIAAIAAVKGHCNEEYYGDTSNHQQRYALENIIRSTGTAQSRLEQAGSPPEGAEPIPR